MTYLAYSLLLPVEHRSMEISCHLNLFWASVSNSLQVYPALPTSSSTVLLQLFLGRPRPLFPCGFHLSACLVTLLVGFLKVSPIQLHLRLLIWVLILSCSALSHSSSLLYYFWPMDAHDGPQASDDKARQFPEGSFGCFPCL